VGRDLMITTINTQPDDESRPKIWLDFGIHAREWITPAVATYVVNELVNNDENKDILDTFEVHIIALHNPDGYAYTFESDRMWRKTRSYHENDSGCIGTDPNRNWAHGWGGSGSSDYHCSEVYHGPEAFSEPETKIIADYILAETNVAAFFTVHSYSQLWMTPWAFTDDRPDAYDDLMDVSHEAVKAIKAVHGKEFIAGSVADVIYKAAGCSSDWAHGGANVKYAFALELRDRGEYGFILPPEQIIPASEETWAGLATAIREIAKKL